MKATRIVLFAAAMAIGGGFTAGCKPLARKNSGTKDFAFSATAANFAVLFGSGGSGPQDPVGGDILRYKNYLATGYLGRFEVALAEAAPTKNAVLAAFQGVASKMNNDSSLFVAYSGAVNMGKLKVADGDIALAEIAAALGGKKFARFILMNDSEGNVRGTFLTRGSSAVASFGQVIEFSGFSAAGSRAGGAYGGRLSAEFSGVTDKALVFFTQNNRNPTLGSFYNAVVAGTRLTAAQPAEWYVSDPAILTQVLFNPATFPRSDATQLNLTAIPKGMTLPDSLNLALIKPDGSATSLRELASTSKAVVFKIATKWCKPCAQMSARLARNEQLQAKIRAGDVALIEILAVPKAENNGQDVVASLAEWKNRLVEADAGAAESAMTHAYGVNKYIAELSAETLARMVPAQATDHCPFMVLLGEGGKVMAGSAQAPNEVMVMNALGIQVVVPPVAAGAASSAGADHQATDAVLGSLFDETATNFELTSPAGK